MGRKFEHRKSAAAAPQAPWFHAPFPLLRWAARSANRKQAAISMKALLRAWSVARQLLLRRAIPSRKTGSKPARWIQLPVPHSQGSLDRAIVRMKGRALPRREVGETQHLPFLRSEFAFRDRLGQTKTLVVPRQRTSLGDLPSAVPKAVLAERRGFRQKPVQRLWARRKSLQQLRLRPLPTEIRRKSILVLPRANQLLSAERPVLKLMQKSFEVAVPQIVGSGKRAAARLQRAQAQRSSREHFRLSGAAIPDHLWA